MQAPFFAFTARRKCLASGHINIPYIVRPPQHPPFWATNIYTQAAYASCAYEFECTSPSQDRAGACQRPLPSNPALQGGAVKECAGRHREEA